MIIRASDSRLKCSSPHHHNRGITTGCTRDVELPSDVILVEQNPKKDSTCGKQARAGHTIAWVMKDGDYFARVVDGTVHILHHQ